jgi:release factor glutamine methyltransferase
MTRLQLYHDVARQLAAAGVEDSALEASLLLRHFLNCRRSDIFLDGVRVVADFVLDAVREAARRRCGREPLAYILGEQEFYGHVFSVTSDVLIPRSETELLVEKAVVELRGRGNVRSLQILDLGVGSGIIAICLALELPVATVVGIDLSMAALQVARGNAYRHGVSGRVRWLNSNWGGALRDGLGFDLVVANPPYVARKIQATLQPELAAEPAMALYGGDDGREDIDRIMADASRLVCPGGAFLMEIGFDQGDYVMAKMNSMGHFKQVVIHRDYAGLPRILHACRSNA